MPIAQIHIIEGRTREQKCSLIKEVTEAIHRSTGADHDRIRVLLYEIPDENWAAGGVSKADEKLENR
ncbi:2-hydroxymuconate tautomerase [Bacillus sp. Marseille-Q3570]|uniref:2-hydroxymuconate tautomerase n=1 Tax=Bacillus sp. Marseille-Q3570 TaxID=2963522 RepID=UPI0021B7B567|nr:2-hydroxymuconate tautomerase [Bacillus sp. Marseille-Q3570]